MAKGTKVDKDKLKTVALGAGMAFGGGMLAEIVADAIAKAGPDWVSENPKLAEAVPALAGAAGLYFIEDKQWHPIFYGMIGAVGQSMGDDIIQMSGFGRTKGKMNGVEADELAKGLAFVEQCQRDGFGATLNGGATRIIRPNMAG